MVRDSILMDEKGYSRLEKEIAETQAKISQLMFSKSEHVERNSNEEVYNNPIILEFNRNIAYYTDLLNSLLEKKNRVVIIKPENTSPGTVSIGSVVTIQFLSKDKEEITVTLVSGYPQGLGEEISTESPLGKAIIGHTIGDEVSYNVHQDEIRVKIADVR